RDASNGAVYFIGEGTRFGISGGGVFGEDDMQFVGIHRGRSDNTIQVSAVSSYHIRQRLYELGYEISAADDAASLQKALGTSPAQVIEPALRPDEFGKAEMVRVAEYE